MLRIVFFLLIYLFIVSNVFFGQDIPKDTSFNIYSTAQKVLKQYPDAKVVSSELPANIIIRKDIVYNNYGNRKLHMDIFYPGINYTRLLPAILLVHGGGWNSGDKSQQIPMAIELANKGYLAATVEYRLSPETKYPAAIHDLKAAIRWLRANSVEYSIDSNKIAILGCSAGGHLAALVGTTNGNKKFEGIIGNLDKSSSVQAIVDIDGILDFTHPAESGKDTIQDKPSVGKLWLGASFKEEPELWIEASPVNYVNNNTPPTIFINSSIERFHAGRDEYIDKLSKWNIYYEVHIIPDTPHPFWLFHPWFDVTMNYTIKFLDKIFVIENNN